MIKIIFDGVLLLRRRLMIKCTVVEVKGTLCYKDNYSEATKMMAEPTFLTDLQQFAKESITDEDCELLAPYVDHTLFTIEAATKASSMAVGTLSLSLSLSLSLNPKPFTLNPRP